MNLTSEVISLLNSAILRVLLAVLCTEVSTIVNTFENHRVTMAAIVSEALAGMAEEQASNHLYDDLDKLQERHRGVIRDQVLPRMAKIQREMRGRRYRVRTFSRVTSK